MDYHFTEPHNVEEAKAMLLAHQNGLEIYPEQTTAYSRCKAGIVFYSDKIKSLGGDDPRQVDPLKREASRMRGHQPQ